MLGTAFESRLSFSKKIAKYLHDDQWISTDNYSEAALLVNNSWALTAYVCGDCGDQFYRLSGNRWAARTLASQ